MVPQFSDSKRETAPHPAAAVMIRAVIAMLFVAVFCPAHSLSALAAGGMAAYVLDANTGQPVTTEMVKYGLSLNVLGLPCAPIWRTPAAIESRWSRCRAA